MPLVPHPGLQVLLLCLCSQPGSLEVPGCWLQEPSDSQLRLTLMSVVQPRSGSRPSGSHRATLKVLKEKKKKSYNLHLSSAPICITCEFVSFFSISVSQALIT